MNSTTAATRQSAAPAAAPHVSVPGQDPIENYDDPTDERHRYIGRVSTFDGVTGTGTLTFVTVAGDEGPTPVYLVLTAAHVIYNANTFRPVSQAYFTPAYSPGAAPGMGPNPPAAPYGIFTARESEMWIPAEYSPGGRYRYDYGVMLVTEQLAAGLDSPPAMGAFEAGLGSDIEVCGYSVIAEGNLAEGTGNRFFDNGNGLAVYNVSTGLGSSGAPVMQSADLSTIVAVNAIGDPLMDVNMGPLLTDEVVGRITAWAAERVPVPDA